MTADKFTIEIRSVPLDDSEDIDRIDDLGAKNTTSWFDMDMVYNRVDEAKNWLQSLWEEKLTIVAPSEDASILFTIEIQRKESSM
mgnify:CR=1 FL=1